MEIGIARRLLRLVCFAGVLGAVTVTVATAAVSWGTAIEVPGSAALNLGGGAQTNAVSCPSVGNCTAGGFYQPGSGPLVAFVADERGGVWSDAIKVPGTAALDGRGGNGGVNSLSCASVGNCATGGGYYDDSGTQAWVADEHGGAWGDAIEVPGTAALNQGHEAFVISVSCGGPGACVAGGVYKKDAGHFEAFVADERGGTWGNAIEVPGTAALNPGWSAAVESVSCVSAGNCAAGGELVDSSGREQPFVVNERGGVWGKAVRVPGMAALNIGGFAYVDSVSCARAGTCAAVGIYTDGSSNTHAFVVDEQGWAWDHASALPGKAAFTRSRLSYLISVSCVRPRFCAAGGDYRDGSGDLQAFVANERGGVWGNAHEVPGTAALNVGGTAIVTTVSCSSAANCAAGGYYSDAVNSTQAFLVSEAAGVWGDATEVPGTDALDTRGGGYLSSISCPKGATTCGTGGFYLDDTGLQAFVTTP
jgi:hypothetical protein